MKQFKLGRVVILIILLASLILVSLIGYSQYKTMQVTYYDTYGIIGDRIGFDTSDERISFGIILPGGSSSRYLNIENGANDMTGYIYIRGNITPFVSVSESPFTLKPYENKSILFLIVSSVWQLWRISR
jgi:hypothetical protein